MSDTMLVALISVGGTLLVSVVTLVSNASIERFKSKSEKQQKEYQLKRNRLNEVYKELIAIINLFPNSSPSDVLRYVKYAPNYSMENFDSILKSLDYQTQDYKEQLNSANIGCERKKEIYELISSRESAKKEITEIRDKYYFAKDKYNSFCESKKVTFDLYAGQDVRNRLVEFEVIIHNVFMSGLSVGDKDHPINNILQVSRRNLVNSMRRDIGIC